ncbi:hypothetical protein [Clostridium beijerinckii]|uniref:hypothetical protein n=1 Tax=Clostridium beijerinckii TaxID=1520 RepID=UPI0015CE2745|nr:hypothetical protein [Clostridium beijerinckii]
MAPLGSGVLLLSNKSFVEVKVFFISMELVILPIRDSKILKNLYIMIPIAA